MTEPIDITEIELADLYKFAFEQQKQITFLLAQLQQAQANIAALEAEIAKRVGVQKIPVM